MRFARFACLLLLSLGPSWAVGKEPLHKQPSRRGPVALAQVERMLLVANGHRGTISMIDAKAGRVVSETAVAKRLTDLAVLPGGEWLLVTDDEANRLSLVHRDGQVLKVQHHDPVPTGPVSICVARDGKFCAVASLWARQVTLFDTSQPNQGLRGFSPINLPFAPRLQWLNTTGTRLVVADSHGGRLAVIDTVTRKVISLRRLDGHNLRGMATSPDGKQLLVTHQMLTSFVPTVRQRVFWGTVMGNVVKAINLDDLLTPRQEQRTDSSREIDIAHWGLYPLGEPGNAAGDPGVIHVTPGGKTLVALGGVHEVALRGTPRQSFRRIKVGRRPTALIVSADESLAYVVNTSDDTVSVIDLDDAQVSKTISLGPRAKLMPADKGEQLFYDAKLSLDGWYSCNSCHSDGHTNGLTNDNFSDATEGTPKQIPTLRGVGQTGPWTWTGGRPKLHESIRASILSTMQAKKKSSASDDNVRAIAAYLRTLPPAPSLTVARGTVDQVARQRGLAVFKSQDCGECHKSPRFTTTEAYDVGLHDEAGAKRFNPPSLLGVSQRGPLFHDGRAATLEEVFSKVRHQIDKRLSQKDTGDLVEYLRSL